MSPARRTATRLAAPPGGESGPLSRHFSKRFARQPAWAAVTELFIGLGWLRAAVAKIVDGNWWSGDYLGKFLADHDGQTLAWYSPFVDAVVSPNLEATSFVVLMLQIIAALSLLAGRYRALGLGLGVTMNLHFVAAGAVNPSAFYLLAQGALLFWMVERWSADARRNMLPSIAVIGLALAALNLPFIATLDPADVVDDPALMMITTGLLVSVGSVVALSSDERQPSMSEA